MKEGEIYEEIVKLRRKLDRLFYLDYTSGQRNNINTLYVSEELDDLLVRYTKELVK